MRCHCVPVIKHDNEFYFMLAEHVKNSEWNGFYEEDGLENTRFETALKAVFEQTWGMVGLKTKLAQSTVIYSSRKKNNYFSFIHADMGFNTSTCINRVINYNNTMNRRSLVDDDIIKVRWFTLDELFSFKNVSQELMLFLLEDLHKFRSDLHLLAL
jgi:ABC-type uncharacterized transport system fused permease/ATPase subunit